MAGLLKPVLDTRKHNTDLEVDSDFGPTLVLNMRTCFQAKGGD